MHHQIPQLRKFLFALASCAALSMLAIQAEAARVTQSKGKQVLLELDGSEEGMQPGSRFYAEFDGKRKAIIAITKVKGNKAIGRVLKGKAPVDAVLTPFKKGGASSEFAGGGSSTKSGDGGSKMLIGVIAGYGMDSQTVKAKNSSGTISEEIKMSGTGFSVKGFGDMPIAGSLGLIGRAGVETFNVKGTSTRSICSGGVADCKTEITYLTADLLVRYAFSEGSFMPYVAGGLGIYFPMSKTTNVLDANRISATTVFVLAGGANIAISDSMYLPLAVEYGMFPPSSEVSTSFITARAGLGFLF